jgi:hypothetical protein
MEFTTRVANIEHAQHLLLAAAIEREARLRVFCEEHRVVVF